MGRTVDAQPPGIATRRQPKTAHVEGDRQVDGDPRFDTRGSSNFRSSLCPDSGALGIPHRMTVLRQQLQVQLDRGVRLFPGNQQE